MSRRGLNSRGYPRRDPANAFAADYAYTRGTLPQADDLFSRSSLLAIPPSPSEAAADRIVDAYMRPSPSSSTAATRRAAP